MARKSLRPQLNQIRAWVRQGRTDAWVAHQPEVTVQRSSSSSARTAWLAAGRSRGATATDFAHESDVRPEDDALIAAELEAPALEAERARAEAEEAERSRPQEGELEEGELDEAQGDDESRPARRRGRRGGRGRRSPARGSAPLEGTFDHGEEGYGLWLDPAVHDNPIYDEHWAGHRPVEVLVEGTRSSSRAGRDDD
jgi:hypothetical protein